MAHLLLQSLSKTFSIVPGRYLKDTKLINLEFNFDNRQGNLTNSVQTIFQKLGLTMTYKKQLSSKSNQKQNQNKKLQASIQNFPPQLLPKLKQQLFSNGINHKVVGPIQVPWFPTTQNDIDHLGKTLLDVKDTNNNDHLQFTDLQYRKRRNQIADIALKYRRGQAFPTVDYTQQEHELWQRIFKKLRVLHKTSMSSRFQYQMEKLNKKFKIDQKIPQLNELSDHLRNQTGFTIKPVHGIVSQREFLNCFAFKIFASTQYLRNTKTPDYTPEPDIVHQIVGHIPMFADKDVAELSHKLGLISLGASDQEIAKLGALYWYTLEFGACKQNGKFLGYGAGIASSIGQIQHFNSPNAKFKPFSPSVDAISPFPLQTVQQTYRVTQSFQKSLKQLQQYGKNIQKQIITSYDPISKSIKYDRNIQTFYIEPPKIY